jgi:hypothetical protein
MKENSMEAAMAKPRGIAHNNRVVMRAIKRLWKELKRPPTVVEVARNLNAGTTPTYESIRELRVLGYLPRDSFKLIPFDLHIDFDKEDY